MPIPKYCVALTNVSANLTGKSDLYVADSMAVNFIVRCSVLSFASTAIMLIHGSSGLCNCLTLGEPFVRSKIRGNMFHIILFCSRLQILGMWICSSHPNTPSLLIQTYIVERFLLAKLQKSIVFSYLFLFNKQWKDITNSIPLQSVYQAV